MKQLSKRMIGLFLVFVLMSSVVLGKSESVYAATFSITRQPANITVSEGHAAIFSIAAEGNGLKYQWQFKKGRNH